LLTVLVIPAIYVVLRDDGDVPKFDWRPPACHHLGRRDEAAGVHRTARWRGGGVATFSRAVAAHGQVLARRKVTPINNFILTVWWANYAGGWVWRQMGADLTQQIVIAVAPLVLLTAVVVAVIAGFLTLAADNRGW
jgi:hypothetical protein